jgi:hypothetical protein
MIQAVKIIAVRCVIVKGKRSTYTVGKVVRGLTG